MAKPKLPRPTDSELAILRVLWKRGPSTVREVLSELGEETGYTTVLKFLQIMTEKGLVQRNEEARTHIYRATAPQQTTQRELLKDFLRRAFDGSAKNLVIQALSSEQPNQAELQEIRSLLDQLEQKKPD